MPSSLDMPSTPGGKKELEFLFVGVHGKVKEMSWKIHSFSKYLLKGYYVLDTVLSTMDIKQ